MNLYLEDALDGIKAAVKQADTGLFSTPNSVSLFPTSNTQAKWRYSKGEKFLKLHDGNVVHHFELPQGESQEHDFPLHRHDDGSHAEFESGATATGFAQVHRSDPGSIYVTLHDGKTNPTYTLRHTGERDWRATPKFRKKKELVLENLAPETITESVKAGIFKRADALSWLAGTALPTAEDIARAPGIKPLLSAGIGGAAGLGYHVAKRKLYNTDEENADEDSEGYLPLLKRIGIPAAGLGLTGLLESTITPPYYAGGAASRKQYSLFPHKNG